MAGNGNGNWKLIAASALAATGVTGGGFGLAGSQDHEHEDKTDRPEVRQMIENAPAVVRLQAEVEDLAEDVEDNHAEVMDAIKALKQ